MEVRQCAALIALDARTCPNLDINKKKNRLDTYLSGVQGQRHCKAFTE